MKQIVCIVLLSSALTAQVTAQAGLIFPKGEVSTTDNHTGTVWL